MDRMPKIVSRAGASNFGDQIHILLPFLYCFFSYSNCCSSNYSSSACDCSTWNSASNSASLSFGTTTQIAFLVPACITNMFAVAKFCQATNPQLCVCLTIAILFGWWVWCCLIPAGSNASQLSALNQARVLCAHGSSSFPPFPHARSVLWNVLWFICAVCRGSGECNHAGIEQHFLSCIFAILKGQFLGFRCFREGGQVGDVAEQSNRWW
jgi:hypothetical protein